MKRIFVTLTFSFFALGLTNVVFGQTVDPAIINWYNTGKAGMQTEKAYKLLKKLPTKTVIVAIIDSGIDINHEDLQGHIWTNEKEIPNNGIDDDHNGYVDDIHGWNFLGSPDGKNQKYARLEMTRVVAKFQNEFKDVDSTKIPADRMADYKLYKRAEASMKADRTQYEQIKSQEGQIEMYKTMIPQMVAQKLGKDDYTLKELKKWKTKDAQEAQIKQIAILIKTNQFDEIIKEQTDQVNAMLTYYLDPKYNDRQFIGDDMDDINDTKYGNNDVAGPNPLHGTHVGGIVGALRGNGKGGDGVVTDVKLMSVRAVPDGDENDKDVALAIRYAVDNGAKVINMSFGKGFSLHQKWVADALQYASDHDVLCVHAAGNDAKDADSTKNFPTDRYDFMDKSFPDYLTIGASTRYPKGKLAASFSNYGQTKVDVFAPGLEIYNSVPGNKYMKLQGTSMAAPMVTGAAAFLKSYFPTLTMLQIKDVLLSTAKSYKGTMQEKPGTDKKIDFGTLSVTGGVIDLYASAKKCRELVK